jgi:hypothetical protein
LSSFTGRIVTAVAVEKQNLTGAKPNSGGAHAANELKVWIEVQTKATETAVMRRVPQPLNRKHHDLFRTELLNAIRNMGDDERVCKEREMRTVLLE